MGFCCCIVTERLGCHPSNLCLAQKNLGSCPPRLYRKIIKEFESSPTVDVIVPGNDFYCTNEQCKAGGGWVVAVRLGRHPSSLRSAEIFFGSCPPRPYRKGIKQFETSPAVDVIVPGTDFYCTNEQCKAEAEAALSLTT